MSKEWKPGDVATVNGDPITFYENEDTTEVMFTNSHGYQHAARHLHVSARPLVVIDPEDREAVERLAAGAACTRQQMEYALREFAAPTPPKPDEPQGLGAVAEDAEGVRWTRVEAGEAETRNPWYPADCDKQPREWDEIAVVRVLSSGVTP